VWKKFIFKQTQHEWQIVFLISALIYLIGALVFIFFGNSNLQKWAYIDQKQENAYDLESVENKSSSNLVKFW
jgi:hypothetical protein